MFIATVNNYIVGSTVRLVGGPVEHMGRVEVYDRTSNRWGTICIDDVYYQNYLAYAICRSLGYYSHYTYSRASYFSNIASSSNSPIINGRFQCIYATSSYTYIYQNLYQCSDFESHLGISPSRCTSGQEFMVFCTRKFLIVLYF